MGNSLSSIPARACRRDHLVGILSIKNLDLVEMMVETNILCPELEKHSALSTSHPTVILQCLWTPRLVNGLWSMVTGMSAGSLSLVLIPLLDTALVGVFVSESFDHSLPPVSAQPDRLPIVRFLGLGGPFLGLLRLGLASALVPLSLGLVILWVLDVRPGIAN